MRFFPPLGVPVPSVRICQRPVYAEYKEGESANEDLSGLRAAVCVAETVGACVGGGSVLQ